MAGGSVGWSIVPVHQNIVGLMPSQGTHLGLGSIPTQGACGEQLITVSLSHRCFSRSLPLPLSLKSIHVSSGEDLKNKIKIK